MKLRNISDESVQLTDSTSRLRFVRPQIEDSGGKRLDIDMPPTASYVFPNMEVSLEPGEETTFDVVKIKLAAGSAKRTGTPHVDVPPGEYKISYVVRLEAPASLQTGELRFVVTEAAATIAVNGGELLEGSKYLPTVLTHRVHELGLEHVVTLLGSLTRSSDTCL